MSPSSLHAIRAPDRIRSSALSGYPDCPRRSAARLFRAEIEAAGYRLNTTMQGVGASIGTAVHAGAALTLTERMTRGALAPLNAVTDCAIEAYRESAEGGILFNKDSPTQDAAERQVVRMARCYQTQVAPGIEPVVVEEQLEADTPFGLVLTGRSDVLAREKDRLRDLKTGAQRGNHKPQIGAYSLLARSNGLPVASCGEDFIQRASLSKPQPDALFVPHDLGAAETAAINVLRHIAADLRVFREGDPDNRVLPGDPWAFPANPASMLCSPKYCPAHGTAFCIEHKQEIEK